MPDTPERDRADQTTSSKLTGLPLSRYTVIDLTHARAGPSCVRHLGDWGAQVIRIEQPLSAEEKEDAAGKRDGFDFQNLHRNKRAITLDLKSEAGKKIFMQLAERADVIVENMRANVKFKLGVDYESVRKVNPRIVYGSISGFGQDGPYAARAGVDQIAQGMGGLMSITGLPGQGPVRVGIPIADLTAGTYLALGITIALLNREFTGEGRWVHTSLVEAQIAMLDFQAARWLMNGEIPKQEGNNHPTGIPTGVFPTSDGHINIAASWQRIWQRLCEVLGTREWIEDPRFKTSAARLQNRDELNALISERTRTSSSQEWLDRLNENGVPSGPIYSVDEVFADPQVQHLRMSRAVAHPKLGELNLVAQPINIGDFSKDIRTATPDLGEHTAEVLKELGWDDQAIQDLSAKQVI